MSLLSGIGVTARKRTRMTRCGPCFTALVALLALAELRRNRTSFMPHDEAARLVTGGIFRLSRNPIYLGDVLILAGLILFWDAVLSLVLVPIFVWVVEKRFIEKEEYRLKRKFLASYGRYSQQTRRWI